MRWLSGRGLLFKIVLGGLATIVLIAGLEMAIQTYFWNKSLRSLEVRRVAYTIQVEMLYALRAQKDFLLHDIRSKEFIERGTTRNLEKYNAAIRALENEINVLQQISTEEGSTVSDGLKSLTETFHRAFLQLQQEYRNPDRVETNEAHLSREKELLATMERAIDGFEPAINSTVRDAVNDSEQARQAFETMSLLVAVLSFTLGGLIFYSLAKSIARPLRELERAALKFGEGRFETKVNIRAGGEIGILADGFSKMSSNLLALIKGVKQSGSNVSGSASEITAAAKQLEATVTEQAASTNEVVATAKQISATSRELAETMRRMSGISEGTRVLAENGRQSLGDMESSMQHLAQSTGTISARFEDISERATSISSIIQAITRIADQTNLLSLNAAIEAEKAGEYGLGFSVVAREIRRLADQAEVSVLDIEKTVKQMQASVSAGVMTVDKFVEEVRTGVKQAQEISHQLATIIEQVQELMPSFQMISEGMQSQSIGAEQISESMVYLNDAAQQTTQSVRDLNRITDGLTRAANTLELEVARFKVSS